MKILNKSILAMTITSFSMAAIAVGGATFVVASAADETHSISVVKDDVVTVSAPSTAVGGARVDFSLDFDADSYAVESVSVNSEKPSKTSSSAYTYSFMMPNEDVTIDVKGRSLIVDTTYEIVNLDDDKAIVLAGIADVAKEGDVVSFSVNMGWNSPYSFTGKVEVFTLDGENAKAEPVAVTNDNGVYSFKMPAAKVGVDVEEVAKTYSIIKDTEPFTFIDKVEYSLDNGETWTRNYDYPFYVKFNTMIRVTLKGTDAANPTHLNVVTAFGETPIAIDESKQASFTMPSSNVRFTVTTAVNYVPVTITNTENITGAFLKKNEDGTFSPTEATSFVPGETVYFQLTVADGVNVVPKNVAVKYDTTSVTVTTVSDTEHIYSFVMVNKENVTISFEEKVPGPFAGASFVGNFYNINIYSNGVKNDSAVTTNMTIDDEGQSSKTFKIESVNYKEGSSTEGIGVCSSTRAGEVIFSSNVLVYAYSSGKTFAADNLGADMYFCVKSATSAYVDSLFSKNLLGAVEFSVDGKIIARFFVDFVNDEFYGDNVTFNVTSGDRFNSTSSTFDVVVNGVTVGTVANSAYTKA
ncbi:MAG: hypothetical protein MR775_02330 [Erysipelotrichaceae bacterium]|nr:hypothetical protein [Erysipelotrichaceae bacterium]